MNIGEIRVGGLYWLDADKDHNYHGKKIVVTKIGDYRSEAFPIRALFTEPVYPEWVIGEMILRPTEISDKPLEDWKGRALDAERRLGEVEALARKWQTHADNCTPTHQPLMYWYAAARHLFNALGAPINDTAHEATDERQ